MQKTQNSIRLVTFFIETDYLDSRNKELNKADFERNDLKTLEVEGEKIIEMSFTKNRLFALTSSGDVYLYLISKNEPLPKPDGDDIDALFQHLQSQGEGESAVIDPHPYLIKELSNIQSIKTGEDHFLALDNNGVVWAMGDDKYGQ